MREDKKHPTRRMYTMLALTLPPGVAAFGVRSLNTRAHHQTTLSPLMRLDTTMRTRLLAKKEEEPSKGMEEAFRQLEEIAGNTPPLPERKKKKDEAFAKAMQELNLKDIVDTPEASMESEAELYKSMASELETTETDLIANVTSDLGGTPTVMPKFDPTARDTELFLEKALEQALADAEKQAKTEFNKESLLDNKEIMKEIEKIFDKANDELLEGIQEMREEQVR
jgi:NurA-like 5'-3' nuclease